MTGRTYSESQRIRALIDNALDDGMETPAQVAEWIARVKRGVTPPTIATISRIMREEMGYTKTESEWTKGK